ncbi:MAG TPA: multidrug effflux MFS transporter [Alphaproteobacteria bacterium]|jgi:DHA1 family bicyclomycin/chloramphenicol resistance-like MFS transporter|nr:multidrug effflux MFS transporter [Alphaproteobacteria bacterium]
MTASAQSEPGPSSGLGFRQFVALVAALMAVNALAIDGMLPALPTIGEALGVAQGNERQWIVTAYMLGFGTAQLFYGTLADRFGRRPVLFTGLTLYIAFSLLAALSRSFETMIAARALQGVGAAGSRVLAVSIVRDCYSGRRMARVMSLSFIVFLAVPIIAPSFGQLVLLVAPWPFIFIAFATYAAGVMIWVWFKLPETMHPEDRRPIAFHTIVGAFTTVLTNRISIGYTMASTVLLGGLFGFINSAQQIFFDVFHAQRLFTTIFAMIALFIAAASLLNSRMVEKFGMRVLSHAALVGYIAVAVTHAVVALSFEESLPVFAVFLALQMFCFGLVVSNFGAIAMDPLGHLAGTASSVQGFLTTIGGALFGFIVGQHFDGTIIPLVLGYAGFGLGGFAIVLIVEKGRLFHPSPAGEARAGEIAH